MFDQISKHLRVRQKYYAARCTLISLFDVLAEHGLLCLMDYLHITMVDKKDFQVSHQANHSKANNVMSQSGFDFCAGKCTKAKSRVRLLLL